MALIHISKKNMTKKLPIGRVNQLSKYINKTAYRVFIFICLFSSQANSQQNSDIWVGKLNLWEKNPITELVQITDTNNYSNQPYFFDNSRMFYTQEMNAIESETQIDVWMFDFNVGMGKNITESAVSEYSPTPLPYNNGMSVIRVNEQGKQELWEIDLQGKAIKNIAPEIEPVGYQVWLNNKELLLFVLGEPNTLQRADVITPKAEAQTIDTDIGASLYRFEKTDWFLYTSKIDGNYLNAYNVKSNKTIQIVSMPENSEYFSVSALGNVFTSDGTTLWQRKLMLKGEKVRAMDKWVPIKITQPECEKGISRTAISPDSSMIALVCPRI